MKQRIKFLFGDQQMFCLQSQGTEHPVAAIMGSLQRRLGAVNLNLWLHSDRSLTGGEVWQASWFDPKEDVYREERVEWIGPRAIS